MKIIVASIFLVAAFLVSLYRSVHALNKGIIYTDYFLLQGCEAIYGGPNYRYSGGCIPKECSQDWSFSYVSCGCVKDGDGAGHSQKSIPKSFPFGIGGRFPNFFPFGQFPNVLPFPGQPRTVVVPGASAPGTVFLPGAPAPGTVFLPGPPGGQIFLPGPQQPPSCGRVLACTAGQYFDERQCACVCLPQACLPNQRFNNQFCQCECQFQIQQCRPFESFNPSTCQCERQGCPNVCNRCENQDPNTCACQPITTCPNGQRLNTDTCQCSCSTFTRCSNSFQRLNSQTCQCECSLFTATIRQEIPGTSTPPSFEPGTPRSAPGTRRSGSPGTRRRGRRAVVMTNDDIEGPEMDSIALSREKRRKGRSRSRSGSSPGTRTLRPGTPNLVPGSQGPSTIITTTQTVRVCPVGTRQNEFSCTCD